jgi:hypothetical protein
MPSYRRKRTTEYSEAESKFKELVGELKRHEERSPEHREIERLLEKRGQELLRLLMQGYLENLAAREEVADDVVGADGKAHPHARERSRKLMTLFGEVKLTRLGYSEHGTVSVFPLDAQLNLPPERYSQGLRERVGEEVARGSYDEAVEHIDLHTGGHVPKRQGEELTQKLARDFDAFYQDEHTVTEPAGRKDLLVMSSDGKGIVMREEDLREQTRQRAQESTHKLSTRLSRGEKPNRKRMATVATVYDVAPHKRSAEDIMNSDKDAPGIPAPKPINKRVWASVQHSMQEVLAETLEEAWRRDPEGKRTWVVLVDGHEEQLRQVYAAIERSGAEAIVIQDFIHVLEYLWLAARCLYKEDDPAGEEWVKEHATDVLRGKSSDVAAGMRRSATRRGLSQAARAPLDKAAQYLLKNRERLNYARALQIGAPIATGVIEGACRHLVKQRMECSGARWSLDGAEAVLRLRAVRMSGDWDAYCAFHRARERLRNYPEYGQDERLAA